MYSREQSQILYLVPQVLHFLSSCPYLHLIFWIPSVRLLTRFDKSCTINKLQSVRNEIFLFDCFLSILVTSFSIGTEKVMYFSLFFPKKVNCFSNLSALLW